MKRFWLASLLLCSLCLLGYSREVPANANNQAEALPDSSHVSASVQPMEIRSFESVNGITLSDSKTDVIAKRGIPLDIQKDPFFKGTEIYEYGSMSVNLTDGVVQSVSVPGGAETLQLGDATLPLEPKAIHDALGNPDFVAEDGLVYQRGNLLLKVFLDTENGEIERVDYYHHASV